VPRPSEDELLAIAQNAAHAAAAELRERFGHAAHGVHAKSTPTDLVSEADVAAEQTIRDVLGQERPDDSILGEEGGATGDGALRWVVDPLDGTINFLFGIPMFAVSVACEANGETVVGVVLDPIREECFAATRSGPAVLNGTPIQAPARTELATSLVATGFGYDTAVRARQAEVLLRVLPAVRDIRRAGSAALDLAWCACGRFDAYYERGVNPWDVAAGVLIAKQAGLVARDLTPGDEDPGGVVVGPPAVIDALYELVA
jgi:myo-inositol-1(or 4)-monophosphatase